MLKEIIKRMYFIYFSFYKYVKYPTCSIYTNFIMPKVKLGKKVIIREGCKVQKNVWIDDYTSINENTQIDSNTKYIGKYCSISHGVKIGMGSHPLTYISTSTIFYEPYRGIVNKLLFDEFKDKGYTLIGHDVLIGANSIILAGVKVGDGAVIAAGSIVTKDVPYYGIVGGNPAKLIKYRFNDVIIEKFNSLKWWNFSIDILKENIQYMSNPKEFIKRLENNG